MEKIRKGKGKEMKNKRMLIVCVAILALALSFAACGGSGGGGSDSGAIKAADLQKEVDKNEAAAVEKYEDQPITVTGYVTGIDETGTVYVDADKSHEISAYIWCFDLPEEDVMSISKGDKVTISGTVNNVSSIQFWIDECTLVK